MKRITKIEGNNAFLNAVRKTRVAAYCRVSTGSDEQLLSLETQKDHYERYIKAHPDWEYTSQIVHMVIKSIYIVHTMELMLFCLKRLFVV